MSAIDRLRAMSDEEAEKLLAVIWLDGYTSGVSSGVMTLLVNRPNPPDQAIAAKAADAMSRFLGEGIATDPLGFEEICNQVRERIMGEDSGLVAWQIPGSRP